MTEEQQQEAHVVSHQPEKKDLVAEIIALDQMYEEMVVGKYKPADAPFATLTWGDWVRVWEQVYHCLKRFLDASVEKNASFVLMLGMEMVEVANKLLLEAYALEVDKRLVLQPVPRE